MNLVEHLKRQIAFSKGAFGPGDRKAGVIDHIRKELVEVEESETPAHEWVDVVILALDGLTRELARCYDGIHTDAVAEKAAAMILAKQGINEDRVWPDWRTAKPGTAIEHDRGFK